jgi:hypothetical protein
MSDLRKKGSEYSGLSICRLPHFDINPLCCLCVCHHGRRLWRGPWDAFYNKNEDENVPKREAVIGRSAATHAHRTKEAYKVIPIIGITAAATPVMTVIPATVMAANPSFHSLWMSAHCSPTSPASSESSHVDSDRRHLIWGYLAPVTPKWCASGRTYGALSTTVRLQRIRVRL